LEDAPRRDVVSALAIEQDDTMQEDQRRIDAMWTQLGTYAKSFAGLRAGWRESGTPLAEQHRELVTLAKKLIEAKS